MDPSEALGSQTADAELSLRTGFSYHSCLLRNTLPSTVVCLKPRDVNMVTLAFISWSCQIVFEDWLALGRPGNTPQRSEAYAWGEHSAAGCPHWPQWHGTCSPAPCGPWSSGSQMRPLVPCAGEGVCGNIKTSKHINFLPAAGGTGGVSPQWCLLWERAETRTPQKGPSCCQAEPSYRNNPSCCVCFWTPTRSLFEALCTTAHGNCHALYSVNPAFEFGPGW